MLPVLFVMRIVPFVNAIIDLLPNVQLECKSSAACGRI